MSLINLAVNRPTALVLLVPLSALNARIISIFLLMVRLPVSTVRFQTAILVISVEVQLSVLPVLPSTNLMEIPANVNCKLVEISSIFVIPVMNLMPTVLCNVLVVSETYQ